MASDRVRITPLGGVGEVGKNCMLIETDDDAILIDAGLKFPDDDMLGVDLVIPDITHVIEKRDILRAIFITHGHEDHIGALPYILRDLDVPVYATAFTHGLITAKLKEHHLLDEVTIRTFEPGDIISVGSLTVEPFAVTHSIPDCVGFAIGTPLGLVVHSGDFRLDATPVYGPPFDAEALSLLGKRGVLALLSDCIRVESPGHTPSERIVGEAFDAIVAERQNRIIIATFASNISRVQQAIDVAQSYNRKVAVVGRSMVNNSAVAKDLGFLNSNGALVKIEEMRKLPIERTMLITTGSQGEPGSGLSRIAGNDHRQIKLIPGDTVIISATPIPGNEESVARTIDNLLRLGAEVIYEPLATVHVSGHASREDLRLLIHLLKPKYCMPIHGQYRQMILFRQVASSVGVPPENVILAEVGDVLEISPDGAAIVDRVTAGSVFVDGVTVGETTDVVLRDRRRLSRDGVVIATVTLDRLTGEMLTEPEIATRGLPSILQSSELIEEAREQVRQTIMEAAILRNGLTKVEYGDLVGRVRENLGGLVYRRFRAHPMILPIITEI